MSSLAPNHSPLRIPMTPALIVQAPTLNILSYLYRTARAANHIPGLARMFLTRLYRETVLGWWWLIFRALLPTLGIIAIFQHVPALTPADLPYALYVVSGMMLWTVVSTTLLHGARALQAARRLIGKLATPKLVFLLASGAVPVCFSLIFAAVLAGLIVFEYTATGKVYLRLDWPLLLCPIPILVSYLFCIGICSFISVASLVARDARYVMPLFSQFLFYLTPVIYTLEIMPPSWRLAISYLNPLASLIEFFRWTLFGVGTWDVLSLIAAIGISFGVFLLGARFLMLCEWAVADVIEAGRL